MESDAEWFWDRDIEILEIIEESYILSLCQIFGCLIDCTVIRSP